MSISHPQSKKQFWNAKILGWEQKRYQTNKCTPLIARREIAIAELSKIVKGKRVLEIGCGSGQLIGRLLEMGAEHYHGVDLSDVAIASAKDRLAPEHQSKVTLEVCDILSAKNLPEVDIVISLGVLDWLSKNEIERLMTQCRDIPYFIHSFSKISWDPRVAIHRIYTLLSYGIKNRLYIPRYYSFHELTRCIESKSDVRLIKERTLGIGAMISNW